MGWRFGRNISTSASRNRSSAINTIRRRWSLGPGEESRVHGGFFEGPRDADDPFDERAGKMYLTVGSSADLVTGDPEMRALAVHRYNPDGTGHESIATGLRNTVGLRFYPGTTQLWATVESATTRPTWWSPILYQPQAGWLSTVGPMPTSGSMSILEFRRRTAGPIWSQEHRARNNPGAALCRARFLVLHRHAVPRGISQRSILANHGSSQREQRVGYSVSFVPFKNGKPAGDAARFLRRAGCLARTRRSLGPPRGAPCSCATAVLLISDDGRGK